MNIRRTCIACGDDEGPWADEADGRCAFCARVGGPWRECIRCGVRVCDKDAHEPETGSGYLCDECWRAGSNYRER